MRSQTLGSRRSLAGLVAVLVAAVVLAGCVVTLISSYDETTDKNLTALQKRVGELLDQLDRTPVPAYDSVKTGYDGIHRDLASLYLRNQARPKNDLTVKQLDELKKALDIFEDQHKKGTLNQAMVAPGRDILNQAFRALLALELATKELNKKD